MCRLPVELIERAHSKLPQARGYNRSIDYGERFVAHVDHLQAQLSLGLALSFTDRLLAS